MPDWGQDDDDVLSFIWEEIDSVPELEALLLLWQHRPEAWTAEDLAKRLYISSGETLDLLVDLSRKELITVIPGPPEQFRYEALSDQRNGLMGRLDLTYRRQIVRVSRLIHSKPSSAVRDFARAFRFTREKPPKPGDKD